MHSSIFEIQTTKNLPENAWATEDDIPDLFLQEIADCVQISEDREGDIDTLLKMFGNMCTREGNQIIFSWNFKNVLVPYYERFHKIAQQLADIRFEKFIEPNHSMYCLLDILKNSYVDNYGFYVMPSRHYVIPLADWIREIAEPEVPYYICGVLDYKF